MKILVLTSRFPYPIEKGDKLRIYHQIRELSKRNEIVLFSLHEGEIQSKALDELNRYCSHISMAALPVWEKPLRLLRGWILDHAFQTAYFFRPQAVRQLQQFVQKTQPDLLYCQLLRMAPYADAISLPKAIDYMDCFSLGMKRQAAKSPFPLSLMYSRESRKLSRYEQEIFETFQFHTIISAQDRDNLQWPGQARIQVVQNGVDLKRFFPRQGVSPTYELVFVGNMGYFPNVQAALYLVKEIMPLVWKSLPACRLLLAGARPHPEVRKLGNDSRITVSGWMEDIRDAYAAGRLFVAPLFTGSGQQNKILEAMAMGIPCMTTRLVNEAIGAEPDVSILLADTPETFAIQIIQHLEKQDSLGQIGAAGLAYVRKGFSWEESVKVLEEGLKHIVP